MFTGISRISFVKFSFSQYSCFYFLKYFRAKFREILMNGYQEIGVFPRKQFFIQSQFFTYYACAAINKVLSVTKKKLRIVGLFAS